MRGLAGGAVVLVVGASCPAAHGTEPWLEIDLSTVQPAPESFADSELGHLEWVLTPDEQAAWRAGGEAERRELMRVVWARLDPMPVTPESERKGAHYRRLAWVRGHFAMPAPPGWDDRGELLLRYGPPDSRTASHGDGSRVPPSETWIYARLGLAFRLEDYHLDDRYRLTNDSHVSSRGDLRFEGDIAGGGTARPWASTISGGDPYGLPPVDLEALMHGEKLARAEQRGREVLAAEPQIYLHDYGGAPLDLAFDALSFRSTASGRTRLEVHLLYRAEELGYVPRDGRFEATLDVEVVAKTPDYREVARQARPTRDVKRSVDDLGGRIVLDEIDLALEPGSYRLAVAVRDSVSRRIAVFQRPVTVAPFPDGELAVSDVQVALDVKPGAPGDPFLKGGLQVAPWPMSVFPRERDLFLYFEIYGLAASPAGDRLYTVELLIRPRDGTKAGGWFGSSKGRGTPGVATQWEGRCRTAPAQEHLALDVRTLPPGAYDLEIAVTDRITERTARRRTGIDVGK